MAMREANRRGVTALHDMDGVAGFRSWRQVETERGSLSLRVWQHFLAEDLDHLGALGMSTNYGSERLRIGGLKLFADGALTSRTAALLEDYEDEPDRPLAADRRRGVWMTEPAELAYRIGGTPCAGRVRGGRVLHWEA